MKFTVGQIVRLQKPVELFGGDVSADARATVVASWLEPRGELLNLQLAGGRGISAIAADRVERCEPVDLEPLEQFARPATGPADQVVEQPAPPTKPKRRAAAKPKASAKSSKPKGGLLWAD